MDPASHTPVHRMSARHRRVNVDAAEVSVNARQDAKPDPRG